MMDFLSGIYILTMENTTRIMAGIIQMEVMIIEAGIVEKKEKRQIPKFVSFVSE